MTTYVLAGGCFWCLDAVYRRLKGVTAVVSGYMGGHLPDPSYRSVSSGQSGHAEAVSVTFDESIISGAIILDLFFLIHDPTTLNRQGNDVGTQYRSAMYYSGQTQQEAFMAALERATKYWDNLLVTELEKLSIFYPAEAAHQDYFNKNPGNGYCSIVITPKIVKARTAYAAWFQE
jgi:peptide-methionine (S)-S-oxide reductase